MLWYTGPVQLHGVTCGRGRQAGTCEPGDYDGDDDVSALLAN